MHRKIIVKIKEENFKFHRQTLLESGGFVPLTPHVWEYREHPLILCT